MTLHTRNYFALLPSILYMPVPSTEQTPFIALRPFFISTSFASFISRIAFQLTQYAISAAMYGFY